MTMTRPAPRPATASIDPPVDLDRRAAGRDRVIDLARAVSMLAVAVGHFLVIDVQLGTGGGLRLVDVLAAVPTMQGLTWVFQVMPVFFFAGGVVGFASWQRHRAAGRPAGAWVAARLWRLAWPTLPVVATWVAATQVGGRVFDLPASVLAASRGVAVVVWFLAVYGLVVAAIPALDTACRRFGPVVPVALLLSAAGIDVAARGLVGDLPPWVFVNYLTVWGAITCLGRWWPASPRHRDAGRGLALAAAAGTALVTTVATGWYPLSMVGVAGAERSNSWPPTVALALLGLVQVGLLVAARPVLVRWLARPATHRVVALLGARAMTVYLWHPVAVAVLALAFVLPGWWPAAAVGSSAWWLLRLAWVVVAALVTVPVVLLAGRWERPPTVDLTTSTRRAVLASIGLSVGWAALALQGFHVPALPLGLPLVALAGLAVGVAALAWPLRGPPEADPAAG